MPNFYGPTTTLTFDREQLGLIHTELWNLAEGMEHDQGIETEDDQELLDRIKALVRRIEAAQRRIEGKRGR